MHRHQLKRMAIASIAVAAMFGLAACGGSDSSGGSKQKGADLLSQVKSSKKLVIGTSNDPPWSAVSPGKGVTGIVPDILKEYLKRANIDATISSIPMPFDSLIPSLTSGRIQMIGDSIYATPERAKVVSFSDTLFYNPPAMVVKKGNPLNINDVPDLCGHTAATYKGTVWVAELNEASKKCPSGRTMKVKVYDTLFQAMQDINTGRVNGALIDSSNSAYALFKNPNLGVELSTGYHAPDKASSAAALATTQKNAAFFKSFNPIYAKMLGDGTVKTIFEKYGMKPTDTWLSPR